MSSETTKQPATDRQIAYIRQLQQEAGIQDLPAEANLSSYQASRMIGDLLANAGYMRGQSTGRDMPAREPPRESVHQARIGLAMKENFRICQAMGWDIWGDRREAFILRTIKTYELFSEVAGRVQQASVQAPSADQRGSTNWATSVLKV